MDALRGMKGAPDLPDADDGGGECGKGKVHVGAALMPNGETAGLGEPCRRPLRLPAMAPVPFAAVDAAPCDTRDDPTGAAFVAASGVVMASVGVELVRPAARSSARPANRRTGVEGGGQLPTVVPVGPAEGSAEQRALFIDDQVPLGARLAAVRRPWPATLRLRRPERQQRRDPRPKIVGKRGVVIELQRNDPGLVPSSKLKAGWITANVESSAVIFGNSEHVPLRPYRPAAVRENR